MTNEELAGLLIETGQRHHQAYAASDGTDPEWPLWYAGYLQSQMWGRVEHPPTRSELVHLLLSGEAELAASEAETPWNEHYASVILAAMDRD